MNLSNIIILIFFVNLVHIIKCKNQFNEFLTEDNELAPLESKTLKTKSQQRKLDGSKLIVNILYQNKDPKPKPKQNKTQIVYATLDKSSGPCDKNVCKSTQICLNRPNDKKKPYECVDKPKKVKREVTTRMTTTTKRKIVLSKGCTHMGLTFLKISLFEIFDSLRDDEKQQIDKINAIEFSCLEPVCRLFSQLDFNHNRLLDNLEWSRLNEFKTDLCLNDLKQTCDENGDNLVSFEEFCLCFQGIRAKCSFVRLNKDSRQIYTNQLNKNFNQSLTSKTYAPMCDTEGYFQATQCDNKVTCWCVRRDGEPIPDTLSGINQTPKDCKQY